jgi:hypothetical protein
MKLNLSKFHKVASDKTHTTLRHEDGHEMKLAHKALSKPNRKALESLEMNSGSASQSMPMAEGGDVSDDDIIAQKQAIDDYNNTHEDEPKAYPQNVEARMQKTDVTPKQKLAKGGYPDPTQQHLLPGDAIPNKIEKQVVGQTRRRLADGGDLDVAANSMKKAFNEPTSPSPAPAAPEADGTNTSSEDAAEKGVAETKKNWMASHPGQKAPGTYAEGGDVCQACGGGYMADGGQIKGDRPRSMVKRTSLGEIKNKMFADGGSTDLPPVPAAAQQDQSQDIPNQAPDSAPLPVNVPGVTPDQQPQAPQAAGPQTQDQSIAQEPNPTMQGAYQQGMKGLQQQMGADTQLAQDQADIAKGNIAAQATAQAQYQQAASKLDATRKSVSDWLQDPQNAVNANKYMGKMDTGQRIGTAVALMLGGLGAGFTGHNDALNYINKQIDNDIDAQKANIGQHQNLLSAIDHEYNDLDTSTAVLRGIMGDQTIAKMQQAAAQAKTPQAQATMTQGIAALQQQMAGPIQQATMRQALMGSGPGGGMSQQDPASFVQWVVPPGQQKEVFNEIKAAQNAQNNHGQLMNAFDQASKDNTIAKRAGHLGFQPASVLQMNALELPMIHDQEGRVNEYEQKTLSDLHPQPGDTDSKIAQKRQGYENFILNKQAAPTAKGFGIDLSKFKSTAPQPAQQIKTVNGVKYMRGPNGEAIKVQ